MVSAVTSQQKEVYEASVRSEETKLKSPGDPTPLPYRELLALTLMMMNEHVGSTMLLPFLGFYVAHLTGQTKEAAGYTSGFLISMFMIGQFCCGKAWGRLSDTYGRKPILLSGVFCSAVAVVLFGLAQSLWMALVTRLLHGLMNGNVAIGKVVVTEITDKTNESKGFVAIALAWALGAMLGPFIGGFLYDPVHSGKLDWLGLDPEGVFARNPALLPAIGASFYSLLAAFVGLVFLPETNTQARSFSCFLTSEAAPLTRSVDSKNSPDLLPHVILNPSKRRFHTAEHQIHRVDECCVMAPVPNVTASKIYDPAEVCSSNSSDEEDFPSSVSQGRDLPSGHQRNKGGEGPLLKTATPHNLNLTVESETPEAHKKEHYGFRQVFSDHGTRTATLMFVVLCGADYGIGEVFPLWAICSVETGGLALHPPDVGVIVAACGLIGVFALLVFPYLLSRYSSDRLMLWQMSTLLTSVSYIGIPYSSMAFSRPYAIGVTVVMILVRMVGLCWAFSTVYIFIAAVAPKEHLGAMNGVAQASGALLRAIVPIFATPFFALSVQYPIPPVFGYYTTFILCAVMLWWGYYLTVGFVVPERGSEPTAPPLSTKPSSSEP